MITHRLYSFTNKTYMSPIQLGIQTAHAVSSLMVKTQLAERVGEDPQQTNARVVLWALESPTIMVCDGGNVASLLDLEERLGELADRLGLPWASFREDEASLAGAITAVCALVPDAVFGLRTSAAEDGSVSFFPRSDSEIDFSSIEGGLPLTEASNPDLHALARIVVLAKLA